MHEGIFKAWKLTLLSQELRNRDDNSGMVFRIVNFIHELILCINKVSFINDWLKCKVKLTK